MVEVFLRKHSGEMFSKNKLEMELPRRVQRHTLNRILEYLAQSNKIFIGTKGLMWIWSDNPKLEELIKKGIRIA